MGAVLGISGQHLSETGHSPHLLQLEVTESMVMQNVEHATSTMRAISDRGVQLAIDDFGTGYSSMSLMKHFPINTLKIDRCFVQDLGESAQDEPSPQRSSRTDGRSDDGGRGGCRDCRAGRHPERLQLRPISKISFQPAYLGGPDRLPAL
jgi:hypothetical protein